MWCVMAGHHPHALADGYDSFENMSNKKKRKIPQSGAGGHGHSNSLSADMANITLSPSLREGGSDVDDGHGAYAAGNSYGYVHNSPGAGSTGLSGPGRGRYGRSGRGSMDRRPLGALSNGVNAPLAQLHQNPKTGTFSRLSYPSLLYLTVTTTMTPMGDLKTRPNRGHLEGRGTKGYTLFQLPCLPRRHLATAI
jgi:hypothetical protein